MPWVIRANGQHLAVVKLAESGTRKVASHTQMVGQRQGVHAVRSNIEVLLSWLLSLCVSAIPSLGPCQDDNQKGKTDPARPRAVNKEAVSLEALTVLRREQKKRDPVTVEVEVPKDVKATTRDLPTF